MILICLNFARNNGYEVITSPLQEIDLEWILWRILKQALRVDWNYA